MVIEDGQVVDETTEPTTVDPSQSYSDLLKGKGTEPEAGPSGEPESTVLKESDQPPPAPSAQKAMEAIELEILGNKFKGNPELFSKVLSIAQSLGDDSLTALSNAEKLAELKRGYDKKFTQNTQAQSEWRKSLEANFGRLPQTEEIQSLGKVWQAYFQNESARKAIDAIINGQDLDQLFSASPKLDPNQASQNASPEILGLKQEIEGLKTQLQQFYGVQEEQKASGIWTTWVDKQAKEGTIITEEIDAAMAPFVTALSNAYPDWDDNKILDEAYKHATIGETKQKIVGEVLKQADKAKEQIPPKMTSKAGEKPDSDLSYSEIIRKHAVV